MHVTKLLVYTYMYNAWLSSSHIFTWTFII